MKYKFIFLLAFIIGTSTAQNRTMDSLNSLLKSAKEDTTRLRLYFSLANACDVQDNLKYTEPIMVLIDKLISQTTDKKKKIELLGKKAKAYNFIIFYYQTTKDENKLLKGIQEKLTLCQQARDSVCVFSAYMRLAAHYRAEANLPKALEYYQKCLTACIELRYNEGIARSKAELADMYLDHGDTVQAIELHNQILATVKEMNDQSLLAQAIMKTGGVYNAIGQYSTALEHYERAKAIFEELNDTLGLMETLKNSGDTYNATGNYTSALLDFKKAVQFAKKMKKPIAVVTLMGRIANVYANASDYENAVACIDEAIKYNIDHIEYGTMQPWLKSKLAKIYYKKKDFRKAKLYSDMTLAIMKESNANTAMDCENLASKIDSACGNYKEAYYHYQQYILLRDKLNSEEVRKAATKEKFQSEYDKQKADDKAEQDRKDLLADEEKRKQKMIIYSVIAGLVVVLAFSIFIFRSLRLTREQKEIIELKEKETKIQKDLIEEKHKEITDSINYAERIQRSFLATRDLLDENLKDYFVLFQPKDVVSGDFYWAGKLNNSQFALVTADSTGHGVPGAIMSLLNITSLEKAIENLTAPADILNHTRNTIIDRLKKDGSLEGGKDGMDCSFLSFDFPNHKLTYSAANNPVWLVRNGTIIEFAPDKMPVGKHDHDTTPFQQHEVGLQTGDVIYAITDGLPDQFGGPKGKKYMYKQLKSLLTSISNLPVSEQKNLIYKSLSLWKGDLEQVDDITIIGIKV